MAKSRGSLMRKVLERSSQGFDDGNKGPGNGANDPFVPVKAQPCVHAGTVYSYHLLWVAGLSEGLPAPKSNICTWICDLGCGVKSCQPTHDVRAATVPWLLEMPINTSGPHAGSLPASTHGRTLHPHWPEAMTKPSYLITNLRELIWKQHLKGAVLRDQAFD